MNGKILICLALLITPLLAADLSKDAITADLVYPKLVGVKQDITSFTMDYVYCNPLNVTLNLEKTLGADYSYEESGLTGSFYMRKNHTSVKTIYDYVIIQKSYIIKDNKSEKDIVVYYNTTEAKFKENKTIVTETWDKADYMKAFSCATIRHVTEGHPRFNINPIDIIPESDYADSLSGLKSSDSDRLTSSKISQTKYAWWNITWQYRRTYIITNNDSVTYSAGSIVRIYNSTAISNASLPGSRLIFNSTEDITYFKNISYLSFKLNKSISPGNSHNYTLYWDNSSAVDTAYHNVSLTNTNDYLLYFNLAENTSSSYVDNLQRITPNGTSLDSSKAAVNTNTLDVTGHIGDAFRFTGSTSAKIISIPDQTSAILPRNANRSFSIGTWFKLMGAGDNDQQYIISDHDAASTKGCYIDVLYGTNKINFNLWGGGQDVNVQSVGIAQDNKYVFVVGTYNHSSRSSKIYVNGSYENGKTNANFIYPFYTDDTNTRWIQGSLRWSSLGRYFNGIIDDTFIVNKTLNPTEISALWNNGDGLSYDMIGVVNPNITAGSMESNIAESYYNSLHIIIPVNGSTISNTSILFSFYANASGSFGNLTGNKINYCNISLAAAGSSATITQNTSPIINGINYVSAIFGLNAHNKSYYFNVSCSMVGGLAQNYSEFLVLFNIGDPGDILDWGSPTNITCSGSSLQKDYMLSINGYNYFRTETIICSYGCYAEKCRGTEFEETAILIFYSIFLPLLILLVLDLTFTILLRIMI